MAKANQKANQKSRTFRFFGLGFNYIHRPKQIRLALKSTKERILDETKLYNKVRFNRIGKKGRYQ